MTVEMQLPPELLLLTQNLIRQPAPRVASRCFTIRNTPYTGGLGAFATEAISAGTPVHVAEEPFVKVVYGPYKKEVCAHCFAYDRGRKMKQVERTSVGKEQQGIAWFCSDECRSSWRTNFGKLEIEAVSQVSHGLVKTSRGKQSSDSEQGSPKPADIERAWLKAEKATMPKNMPLLHEEDDQDTVFFLLDGILSRSRNQSGWVDFLSLNPSLQPYDTPGLLASHIRMFQYLRFSLSEPLRQFCTAETVIALVTRDHGNSFGIFEDELGRDGEMLGYGTWTDASFFNHSCGANLTKRRYGRSYIFAAKRDIAVDEELCINYIEDAAAESLDVRRKRLQAGWGFHCCCVRCTEEESAGKL